MTMSQAPADANEQGAELISAIVVVGNRVDDLASLHREYVAALDALGRAYEIVYVIDGPHRDVDLKALTANGANGSVKLVELAKAFGESTALMVGFQQSQGTLLVTLPAYYQMAPEELTRLLLGSEGADMLVAHRWPRAGGALEQFRRRVFHAIVKWVTGLQFRDLGCNVRIFPRQVLEEIVVYGDQHRFLPLLAEQCGYVVREIDVRQSPKDHNAGRYRLREYLHRMLDIFAVFFLVRFTKKPLRFFGMIGSITFLFGATAVLVLVLQRLFWAMPLADRPALLLSALLLVLGVQIFALGLLGELIIFTHAPHIKEYTIRAVHDSKRKRPEDASWGS
jgi:glycosyltransferase involved in cell wall biosynthesis